MPVLGQSPIPHFPVAENIIHDVESGLNLAAYGLSADGSEIVFDKPPLEALIVDMQTRTRQASQRVQHLAASREELKHEEHRSRGKGRQLQEVNERRKALNVEEDKAKRQVQVTHDLANVLSRISEQFQHLQQCPCCRSTVVTQQPGTSIMTCQCRTQWGRRRCPSCHRDYAFIIPPIGEGDDLSEVIDVVRLFGADICAMLLPPTSAPFEFRSTLCPHCNHGTRWVKILENDPGNSA